MSRKTILHKKRSSNNSENEDKIITITNEYSPEPPFVKLYLQDVSRMNGLSSGESSVLHEFVKLIDYENRIQLSKYIKEDIANNKLNCSVKLIEKTLYECIKKGILMKLGSGTYLANPNIFGRGEWRNILSIVMTITYDSNGRLCVIKKDFENSEELFENVVKEDIIEYKIKRK